MSVYTFDLLLPNSTRVDDEFYDKMAINGALDILVITSEGGPVIVNFMRWAANEQEAIQLAKDQMLRAGYDGTVRRHSQIPL